MSGFCYFCLCVTALCALIASGRNVTNKLRHKGRDVSRKLLPGEGGTPLDHAKSETLLFPAPEETPLLPVQGEISWYSCGDRHCRCRGALAECHQKNLRYIPQLPPSVTILDFSDNNISRISDNFLLNVTGLTELDLSCGTLQFISPDAFSHFTKLTSLILKKATLTTEAVSVVFNIPTLEKLMIQGSVRCDKVEDIKLMHPRPRLRELNIGSGYLVTLNLSWFSFFPGLTRLEITSCNTKMFNHQSLHNLSNLTYLDMSYSKQSCDALSTVLTIPSLKVLLLRRASNCSACCDIGTRTDVPRLQRLDLGDNWFEDLNLTCLSPFALLTHLHLDRIEQYVRVITDYHALNLLPNLKYLDLSKNYASCDDLTRVLTIPSLQDLIMPRGTVCTRYNGNISLSLGKVDLSQNNLMHVNFSLPQKAGSSSSLQILDLRGNQLKSFTVQTCHNNSSISMFPFMEALDMSDNSLSTFNNLGAPVCLPRVRFIVLRGNLLPFGDSLSAGGSLGRLETLDVSEQKKALFPFTGISKDTFRNKHLKRLSLGNNVIVFVGPPYSVDADCFSGCPNLIYLSLDGNHFKGVGEERFRQLFGRLVHLRELSLVATGIFFVTVGMFQGLKSLQKLDLSKNSLVFLPDDVFQLLPNLTTIDISGNKISVVKESTFSFTTRLRLQHADLSENPFDCSCQVLWFQKWLLANPSLFDDDGDFSSDYSCGNVPGTTVQSFFVQKQACLLSPETSKFIITTVSMIFLGMSLLSFLYRYRWHIRLVLFEAFRGPGDRLRRLRKHRFEYDVFVSYDSEDFLWVRDHLIPSLERRMGLKLCIHQRDFIIGWPVVENIMGCLNSSKKMLMLFSKAFVESQWCQFELQLCLSHAMDTEDALIVVMLEDIPPRDLTPAMMAVMKTTTYVEWADDADAIDSFWGRMRLALDEVLQNY